MNFTTLHRWTFLLLLSAVFGCAGSSQDGDARTQTGDNGSGATGVTLDTDGQPTKQLHVDGQPVYVAGEPVMRRDLDGQHMSAEHRQHKRERERQERERIFQAGVRVQTLYFTKDGRQFFAAGNLLRATVDEATGELGYAAWQCTEPDCPERPADGGPFVFSRANPLLDVDAQGRPAPKRTPSAEDLEEYNRWGAERACPACGSKSVTYYITPKAKAQQIKVTAKYKAFLKKKYAGAF